MRIRIFHRGEPLDLSIEASDGEHEVSLERPEGKKRFALAPIRMGSPEGALLVDGRPVRYLAERRGARIRVAVCGEAFEFDLSPSEASRRGSATTRDPQTRSPMPGKVLEVAVEVGARVNPGDPLLILEAMKMENVLCAEVSGSVAELLVGPGDMVEPGKVLVVIKPDD